MAMDKAIRDFPKQFEFSPVIENTENFKSNNKFIVCGMGGSHLAADLLKIANPDLDIIVHSNYGLPKVGDLSERLIIVNSYSGNTEESLDSFNKAHDMKLDVVVVSTGGKLLELAKDNNVSFIKIPDTGIQPRSATGFTILALLKFLGDEDALTDTKELTKSLDDDLENVGQNFAKKLEGRAPIIYSSTKNEPLAQNWKIKFNETAKIPAFFNVFPELNHNEMTGFDLVDSPTLTNFIFIFLHDSEDDPRIIKRMDITKKLLKDRGFGVEDIKISGENVWYKIFSTLLVADWASFYLAKHYGAEPEQVPMVEEFKKMIS